ncbi:M28 family peptidase [Paradesulfitobacterium ferrireducens]|uniref:M28 family peptidase n=1 Tax=Paradesulfitobacterium ferrireducens TaxID=2816476 RepID=UPI001A8E33DE|nr:M28 family peptidase [Paradesulfitobacterium ferrireducens]
MMTVKHASLKTALLTFFLLIFMSKPAAAETQFSADKAYQHVQTLVQKIGPRPAGSKGETKAAQYIYYILEQYGWKVTEQPFSKVVVSNNPLDTVQKIKVVNSQNIIAELPGTHAESIVLGAHYDSAGLSAPGAVDNASGAGVLLELARVLSAEPHEDTYQLVFFGAEEMGLVGSGYFVERTDLSAVKWMLNLDMIGTPLLIDGAGKTSAPWDLLKQVTKIAQAEKIPFHLSRDFMVMTRDSSQGGASDFSSFLAQGVPAVGLGIAGRPAGYFHQPGDKLEQVAPLDLKTVGDFAYQLVKSVKVQESGPRTWDELYLTFQVGPRVLMLPTNALRLLTLLIMAGTALMLVRVLKPAVRWKDLFKIMGVTAATALADVLLSGSMEFIWQTVKQTNWVWYAYPGVFVGARVFALAGLLLLITNLWSLLKLPQSGRMYWLGAVIWIAVAGLGAALVRVDLAFPFIFWLALLLVQYFRPSFILTLFGPYFIYKFHWELLNSEQWVSYYETVHRYPVLFAFIYTVLLIPLMLAGFHVIRSRTYNWRRFRISTRKPIVLALGGLILGLGLVPAYTTDYPQVVILQEEWVENKGQLVIRSPENLPSRIHRQFNSTSGKSVTLPAYSAAPPLAAEATVNERAGTVRTLDVNLSLNYGVEPYLLSITLSSPEAFQLTQGSDFLPSNKLPKKVELKGKKGADGNYNLTVERTPPQRHNLQLTIEASGRLEVTVEGTFPVSAPALTLEEPRLAVHYQTVARRSFNF